MVKLFVLVLGGLMCKGCLMIHFFILHGIHQTNKIWASLLFDIASYHRKKKLLTELISKKKVSTWPYITPMWSHSNQLYIISVLTKLQNDQQLASSISKVIDKLFHFKCLFSFWYSQNYKFVVYRRSAPKSLNMITRILVFLTTDKRKNGYWEETN